MQLKIQRSQRTGGVLGKTVFFALDVRADYTRKEQENITKYKLGSAVIYNSAASKKHLDKALAHADGSMAGYAKGFVSLAMAKAGLNITMNSLGKGQHIECKDLFELVQAEETIMEACKSIKQNLALAESFDGRTVLIDFDEAGEKVHRSNGMPDLTRHAPPPVLLAPPPAAQPVSQAPAKPRPEPELRAAEPPMADEPMRPAQPMRPEASFEPDSVPLLDRLDEETKSKLVRGGVAAVIFFLVLYALVHGL